MWLLHFLPDNFIVYLTHALLVLGIVGTFLTFVVLNRLLLLLPILAPYHRMAQIVSVVLLILGIYLEGVVTTELSWRARVREMEAKVAKAEAESKEANAQLEASGKDKIKAIKQRGQIVYQYIDREVSKYDKTCVIPQEVVKAHNAAAKNEELK